MRNMRKMFYDEVLKYGDKEAFIEDSGKSMTYSELDAFSKRVGEHVVPRKVVLCLCQNSIASVSGYVAFLASNVVPVLISKDTDRSLIDGLIDTYKPGFIYSPEERLDIFGGYETVFEESGYHLMKRTEPCEYELFDELALLMSTSGTTGSSKLVRQSRKNIQANAESIAQYLGITADERPVTTLPMFYCYGLSVINSHLLKGATILLTGMSVIQKAFWDFMKGHKATSFAGVPYTFEMLKRIRYYKLDLPDLRYITQSGGKMPPQVHEEFARWTRENGKQLFVMYGATESTSRMGYLPPERSVEKAGSMGVAIPGGRFFLKDDEGNEITSPDTECELFYEGDNVTLGYATCIEELSDGDMRNGVLQTGDMAVMDEEGFYYITGRKSRFLKIYGLRVGLDEVERILSAKYEGCDIAATGTDAKLIIYTDAKDRTEEMRRYICEVTHLNEISAEVRYMEVLPRGENGKVQYSKLDKE